MRIRAAALTAVLTGTLALAGATAAQAADPDPVVTGAAIGSPGFLSGNVVQLPVAVPVNACGNSLGLFSFLNPAFANYCY
ncbi:chaplin [Streptomyces sp. NPDC086787]|uniref:chaplin n=1 Tax=Streptomyces sp. NPDC086787 TaxID=3365759 RepID=UPI00380A4201